MSELRRDACGKGAVLDAITIADVLLRLETEDAREPGREAGSGGNIEMEEENLRRGGRVVLLLVASANTGGHNAAAENVSAVNAEIAEEAMEAREPLRDPGRE